MSSKFSTVVLEAQSQKNQTQYPHVMPNEQRIEQVFLICLTAGSPLPIKCLFLQRSCVPFWLSQVILH